MGAKAGTLGSIGTKMNTGKGARNIVRTQLHLQNHRNKNLEVSSVDIVDDKFVFKIKDRKLMTVTAKSGIKRKIVEKLCQQVPVPENP